MPTECCLAKPIDSSLCCLECLNCFASSRDVILASAPPPRGCISSTLAYTRCRTVHGLRTASASASTPRVTIRGDKLGMSSKAALAPSQLESHITHLMRASFSQLKVHPHFFSQFNMP